MKKITYHDVNELITSYKYIVDHDLKKLVNQYRKANPNFALQDCLALALRDLHTNFFYLYFVGPK